MEATTIIEPGSIINFEDRVYLVTVSSKQYPGSFNAYPIGYDYKNDGELKWHTNGPRREFTSAKDVEYSTATPLPSQADILWILNGALFDTERKVTDLRESVNQWVVKWEDANDALIEAAVENDLCEKFDEVAESIGMRGCQREFDVTFNVTYSVSATVMARNEDEAQDKVSDWEDEDYLNDRVETAVRYDTPEVDNIYVERA